VSGLVSKIEKWYIENTVSTCLSLFFTHTMFRLAYRHWILIGTESRTSTLYISKHFDLAKWWASEGNKKHVLLLCAVPAILSLPASNGHQECTFSTCTHFNDNLRQRLSAEKFEQLILLAANKENTSIKIPTEKEAQAIIEEAIIKVTSKESNATIVASVLESLELNGLDDETFHDVAISLAEHRELFSNK
jgi:hypothetical protein